MYQNGKSGRHLGSSASRAGMSAVRRPYYATVLESVVFGSLFTPSARRSQHVSQLRNSRPRQASLEEVWRRGILFEVEYYRQPPRRRVSFRVTSTPGRTANKSTYHVASRPAAPTTNTHAHTSTPKRRGGASPVAFFPRIERQQQQQQQCRCCVFTVRVGQSEGRSSP